MLGKLIRHEWKSVYKMGSIMLLAMLAVTLIGVVMFQMPFFADMFMDDSNMSDVQVVVMAFTLMISFMLYIFLLMGVSYGIVIFMGVNFYKTMYSDQGYLTHTLPVTANQILISKTLVAGIWYVLVEIAILASVFGLVFSFISGIIGPVEGYTLTEALSEVWQELVWGFESEFGSTIIHFSVVVVLMVIIAPFTTMIILFSALTIGQLSKKHKALMGILAYFGIGIINTIIASIVQVVYTVKVSLETLNNPSAVSEMDMLGIYDYTLVIQIVMAVVLYWVSHQILTKKLNME